MNSSPSFLSATSAPLRLCVEKNRRDFLRDACYFLFLQNRQADAAKWFKVLGDKYPDKTIIDGDTNSFPRNVTLDDYCFAKLEEAVGETSEVGMKNALEGLTVNSYMALLSGDEERAAGFKRLSELAHARYNSKVSDSRKEPCLSIGMRFVKFSK